MSILGDDVSRHCKIRAAVAVRTVCTAVSPTRYGNIELSSGLPVGDTNDDSSDTSEK